MSKKDLTQVTFIIPVRIDSPERLENLTLVLGFIKNNFETTIIVLEADIKEYVENRLIDNKIFVEDHDPVFHRTKYLNKMIKMAKTADIAIWDADVIVPAGQVEMAIQLLQKQRVPLVFPFDGRFYDVPALVRSLFFNNSDIRFLNQNIGKMHLMHGLHSVGGAFIIKKEEYENAGLENENFYGWGPEDVERVKRLEILGYDIGRVDGPLFHLSHPRKENSWFVSKDIEINNRQEIIRICRMSQNELILEINENWK